MPPDSPRTEHEDSLDDYPSLTDQNVAILYEIVQTAETQPKVETQPFRAIFAAYDKVLPQYGLDPAQDQLYLRFLFRLGDKKGTEESLFQGFERLLEDLGIQIEFNTEEDAFHESASHAAEADEAGNGFNAPRRSRRASIGSIYDGEDESTRAIQRRAVSRASISQLATNVPATRESRPTTRATTRPTEKIRSHATVSRRPSVEAPRGRLTAEDWANESQRLELRHPLAVNGGAHQDRRNPVTGSHRSRSHLNVAATSDNLSSTGSAPQDQESDAESAVQSVVRLAIQPPQNQMILPAPTRTQLLRDADTFQHYKIRSLARVIVDKWCDAAFEARNHHEHLQRTAVAHDTEILLRQAFEHWRTRMHARKVVRETERFFQRLESRAIKARNLYLLTKAFTHWVQCAEDEARSSSLARQHVIGLKYFHAWRDITVENQNKVQFQGLKKFFGMWKQRYVRTLTQDIHADLLYQRSLVKSGYWKWFWMFCERRAPEWHARKLRQRFLWKWLNDLRTKQQRMNSIVQNRAERKEKILLLQWLTQARSSLSNERQVVVYHNQKAAARSLHAWKRQAKLVPLAEQVSNIVDWRVAGATFAVFVNRFRSEKHAQSINRFRIMRALWTQWNDRLRWQTLAHRIDDRRLLEALYRWVIAERYLLLRRFSGERLKVRYFYKWCATFSARVARREENVRQIGSQTRNSSLRAVMSHWRQQLQTSRQAEQVAIEFHAPKVTHETLELWKHALKHTRYIEIRAKHASLYFPGKWCLKRWREATSESRKHKRREAYIQVRRTTKMHLASRLLQRWHSLADHVRSLQQQAADADQQRTIQVATFKFDHWKNSHDLCLDHSFDAVEHYDQKLVQHALQMWTDQTSHQWQLKETAFANAVLRVQKTALISLRKFRLKMLEVKGQRGKAEGLRLNYERRHFQTLLRKWRNKTAERQDRPIQPPIFSARNRKTRSYVQDDRLGTTKRAEDWTEFDTGDWIPGTEAEASTSPIPGYLSTPSKRAARAKALVQSTTPTGTPFQNRLRMQLNATPNTSRKGPFRRSTNLRGSTFEAILEDAPRTPGPPPAEGNG